MSNVLQKPKLQASQNDTINLHRSEVMYLNLDTLINTPSYTFYHEKIPYQLILPNYDSYCRFFCCWENHNLSNSDTILKITIFISFCLTWPGWDFHSDVPNSLSAPPRCDCLQQLWWGSEMLCFVHNQFNFNFNSSLFSFPT